MESRPQQRANIAPEKGLRLGADGVLPKERQVLDSAGARGGLLGIGPRARVVRDMKCRGCDNLSQSGPLPIGPLLIVKSFPFQIALLETVGARPESKPVPIKAVDRDCRVLEIGRAHV